jgi:uncharacterized protein (TIGR03086 family)
MDSTVTDAAAGSRSPGADPRPGFARAVALAGQVIAGVRAGQADDATPCPDYSVRDLSDHLVSILRRVAAIGRGGDVAAVPLVADDVTDAGRPDAWAVAVRDAEAVWSDPGLLGRPVTLPFATLPGSVALGIYTTEVTLHTWDLATATGQTPTWDPAVLASSLAAMGRAVPAEPRGGAIPFGPVVDVPAGAPPLDRLVAWYGRRP